MIPDMWHMICDMWHVTHAGGMHFFLCYPPSSKGLGFMIYARKRMTATGLLNVISLRNKVYLLSFCASAYYKGCVRAFRMSDVSWHYWHLKNIYIRRFRQIQKYLKCRQCVTLSYLVGGQWANLIQGQGFLLFHLKALTTWNMCQDQTSRC